MTRSPSAFRAAIWIRLTRLGAQAADILSDVPGVRSLSWSGEEIHNELSVQIDRERAAQLALSVTNIGNALRFALDGEIAGDFLDGDQQFDIRVKLPQPSLRTLNDLQSLLLFAPSDTRPAVHLSDVARIKLLATPSEILRDMQQRMVEINASPDGSRALSEIIPVALERLAKIDLPDGYRLYDAGSFKPCRRAVSWPDCCSRWHCSWCSWSWPCSTNRCAIRWSFYSACPSP